MNPLEDNRRHITRRALMGRTASGIGIAALSQLMGNDLRAASVQVPATQPVKAFGGLAGLPHFPAKVKRVIYMFKNGAPSHVDLFDYKPKLKEWHGKEIPAEIQKGQRLSSMTGGQKAKPVLSEISK